MDFLDEHLPLGGDGLLGLLHAVAVSPSDIPPPRWMGVVLPEQNLTATEASEQIIALVLRCFYEVVVALAKHRTMTPAEDDEAACEHFAAGYVAGPSLIPSGAAMRTGGLLSGRSPICAVDATLCLCACSLRSKPGARRRRHAPRCAGRWARSSSQPVIPSCATAKRPRQHRTHP
jgi:hypothetical protein